MTDTVGVPFDELPRLPGSGLQHAWDVWGPGDNLGTLNRLTSPVVAAAAAEVRTGERVGISLPLGLPNPPFFGRQAFTHTIMPMGPLAWDDWLDGFYLQCSTQWDGLRHVSSGPEGLYGGWQGRPDTDPGPLGIQHWAERGIIGRGVLLDLAAFAGSRTNGGYDPFTRVAFDADDLSATLRAQRVTPQYGDILCVRTGWMDAYLAMPDTERTELAARMVDVSGYTSAGLAGSEAVARFLWDSGVAAVACDNPAVEAVPADRSVGFLHGRLIPHLGFAIGELFDFSSLAAACQRAGRFEFLFVSVPLNVTGAIGSPGNAVAILLGDRAIGRDQRSSTKGGQMSDPKEVVRRFFETLGTGDFAAIGEFFDDDSVWMVNDVARGLPAQRGRTAIIDDFLQPVREGLFEPGDPKIEIRRLIGEGSLVVAETTGRGMLRNGNHYENQYVFVIEVDGDTVRFLREYMDSDYAHSISAGSGPADGDPGDHVAQTLRRLGHD